MPFGYIGQNQTKQQVKNSGVLSSFDISLLEKKGQASGSLELIEEQTFSSTVSAVDFTSIQGAKYDVHFITFNNVNFVSEQVPSLRFFESGVLETASVYQYALQSYGTSSGFAENKSTGDTYCLLGNYTNDTTNGYAYIYNANDSSKYTFVTSQSMDDDQDASPSSIGLFGGSVLPQASTVDGIRFTGSASANFSSFTVKLFGIKEIWVT